MARAVLQNGVPREDPGEGFEKGGAADKCKRFRVSKSGGPKCDGINTGHE